MKRIALVLLLVSPTFALAQALPNINSLRVGYNTRKTAAKAEGELKVQLDAIDKAIADANKLGNAGEVRRQIAKGLVLLSGAPWTPALDYQNSLALRTDRIVVDSSLPYTLRLEQIYTPSIELTPALTAKVSLRKRVPPPSPGTVTPPVELPGRALGTFDAVSRDLRESPFVMELDMAGAEDGAYLIDTEVFDGASSIGKTSLGVQLQKGLDARLHALEAGAAKLPEALRADVLYPSDFIRNVNRGRVGLGTFNLTTDVAAAEAALAASKTGRDPFKGRTGDMERHYPLAGANGIMPYRVYVPKEYSGSKPMPLVIALHGLGGTEDGFFDNYDKLAPELAEEKGFLMAGVLGYRSDGFYGSQMMNAGDVASKRRSEFSEKDVMEVLRLMKANYKVDESRIYLMGHSMGAIGAWYLGAAHPEIWAAVVTFAGAGTAATVEKMKAIPMFAVHGDADNTVNVNGSRTMVAAMKKAGMDVTYLEVRGGSHTDIVVPNLPLAFEFMSSQKKAAPGTASKQ